MILLTILLAVGAVVVLLPVLSECLSLLRLPFVPRPARHSMPGTMPKLLFLVPAHDEELLLPRCLATLAAQRYPVGSRRVIVIADNCSDATADVARRAGAEVLVRFDLERRGKPWAISWALEQVSLDQYDGVVIIDADTEVSPNFSAALAARAPLREKVLQPFIDVQNPDESALTRLAAIYAVAVHGLSYRVKERVGLNVPLGVGMCLGSAVLQKHGWPAFSIGEDHELYAILTSKGVRIEPVEQARITAQEATGLRQSASQRHRWTAGRRQALVSRAADVITSSHIGFAQRLDALAELTWFGPVMSLWFAIGGASLSWLLKVPGGTALGFLFLASLVRPVGYSLVALAGDRSPIGAIGAFFYLPIYLLWRVAPGLRSLLHMRGGSWVRTDRHAGPETRP